MQVRTRRAVNWVNLSTPLGLGIARAGRARVGPGPYGLHLATSYRLPIPRATAFTVGDVIVTRLAELPPALLAHESRHAEQWARWVVAFLPAYAAASAWSWLRSGNVWARNPFEIEAGLADGGYVPAT